MLLPLTLISPIYISHMRKIPLMQLHYNRVNNRIGRGLNSLLLSYVYPVSPLPSHIKWNEIGFVGISYIE
ncbi:hypothetical protein FKM82_007503 [Ascaphus truei]